jgi:hypothetical protein
VVDGLYLSVLGRPGVAITGEVMVRQVAGVRKKRKGGRRGRKEGRRGELVLPHTHMPLFGRPSIGRRIHSNRVPGRGAHYLGHYPVDFFLPGAQPCLGPE